MGCRHPNAGSGELSTTADDNSGAPFYRELLPTTARDPRTSRICAFSYVKQLLALEARAPEPAPKGALASPPTPLDDDPTGQGFESLWARHLQTSVRPRGRVVSAVPESRSGRRCRATIAFDASQRDNLRTKASLSPEFI